MRRFFPVFLALIAFTFPVFAQAKHPFTFEDMMKLKRVGEPVVSPDGKWVIFSVVDVDLEANTKTPHIWIVPTAGGQEREIIADQDADRPRWRPDGTSFAFISTKEGGSQIWIAEFDSATGTVPKKGRLTDIATEASGETWSPNGKFLIFTSDVYPECDEQPDELACNANKVHEHENSKVKALVFDHLLYRHWNAYKEGKRSHIFCVSLFAIVPGGNSDPPYHHRYRDLTPGDYDAPVFSLGGQDDYAFSPDGKEVCYTSNHDKNPAASTNNDLWTVPAVFPHDATSAQVLAQTKNITADNPASDSTPLYSPDGRYIAYRAQQRPGYESDRFQLMLYDRKTGEKRNLTENFDRWVGTFAWSPNSERIFFSSEDKGNSPIYELRVSEGSALKVSSWPREIVAGFNDDLALTANGERIFFSRMSISAPIEIFAAYTAMPPCHVDYANGRVPERPYEAPECQLSRADALTHVNGSLLGGVLLASLSPFWFTGAHNDKVEGFLVKPPDFDASKKYPVKFLIHGGPEGAWGDDWSFR
ncbi:MAG: S9 family peptidase, partial [Candidatus Sulfotelmatobacter sp.]